MLAMGLYSFIFSHYRLEGYRIEGLPTLDAIVIL